ncbi:MAG: STAS domain-containing protein, partial [Acidobacteriota bacterium]
FVFPNRRFLRRPILTALSGIPPNGRSVGGIHLSSTNFRVGGGAGLERGTLMTVLERILGDITIMELDGRLALEGNVLFRKQAEAAVEAGVRKLILNLAAVDYMDSSGLGELIAVHRALRKVDGQVKLLHMKDRLQQLLVITHLMSVFEIFDSESAAIASFSETFKGEESFS